MLDLTCLSRHRPTLRQLGLTRDSHLSPTVADLGNIIKICSKLEGLAVDFPIIEKGHGQTLGSEFDISGVSGLSYAQTELEAFLVCKT
jgi:hypothetical protein